jgi:hypothetical protein
MLTREKAKDPLSQLLDSQWQAHQLADVAALPPTLREIAYGLLDRDKEGQPYKRFAPYGIHPYQPHPNVTNYNLWQDQIYEAFFGLSDSERAQVLAALYPGFSVELDLALKLTDELPYTAGYMRRAFRVKDYPLIQKQNRRRFLSGVLYSLNPCRDKDILFLAEWANHLNHYSANHLGQLFAATLNAGSERGQALFDLLLTTARGEHPTAAMGRHVTTALLAANRPDGWEFIEKMLLAAQREEGLRQVILETVDTAHPEAFRRMLRLILTHDLTRFSATVRAADVWFGFGWDYENIKEVRQCIEEVVNLLENPAERDALLTATDDESGTKIDDNFGAHRMYLALWVTAYEDVLEAIRRASELSQQNDLESRFVAAYFLSQVELEEAYPPLADLLGDPDLRVVGCALNGLSPIINILSDTDLFERLEALLKRVNGNVLVDPTSVMPLVWQWSTPVLNRATIVHHLMNALGSRPVERILPYFDELPSWHKVEVARRVLVGRAWDETAWQVVESLLTERTAYIIRQTLQLLSKEVKLTQPDVERLEAHLTRKSSEIRKGICDLILAQPDDFVLGSLERLLSVKNINQRLSGLTVLREMHLKGRALAQVHSLAQNYRTAHPKLNAEETDYLNSILKSAEEAQTLTLENAFGLINPAELSPVVPPRRVIFRLDTPAARACLLALDNLVASHAQTPVNVTNWRGTEETLLGNLTNYGFPYPDARLEREAARAKWLLRDEWLSWKQNRSERLRDEDGLELVRALMLLDALPATLEQLNAANSQPLPEAADATEAEPPARSDKEIGEALLAELGDDTSYFHVTSVIGELLPELQNYGYEQLQAFLEAKEVRKVSIRRDLKRADIVRAILTWFLWDEPVSGVVEMLLDGFELSLARVAPDVLKRVSRDGELVWRNGSQLTAYEGLARNYFNWHTAQWQNEQRVRLWQLLNWYDRPFEGAPRHYPSVRYLLEAHRAGGATTADIYNHFCRQARVDKSHRYVYYNRAGLSEWSNLTSRRPPALFGEFKVLAKVVGDLRKRVVELELERSLFAAETSDMALAVRWSGGITTFVGILTALEKYKEDLRRGYAHHDTHNRAEVLTRLLHVSHPDLAGGDNAEEFTRQVRAAGIGPKRLVEAAVYAPQWASYIERTLERPGFAEAVWWLHAHTKDHSWQVEQQIRESWQAAIGERTPLSASDLLDGAVDLAWFNRFYTELGATHWQEVYAVAKYTTGGIGHARAKLFADCLLDKTGQDEIVNRIVTKRNQDALRGLGLLPLSADNPTAKAEVLDRYRIIQEFKRGSREFGAQRRTSEALAARIALENLARTAGYPDPLRLEWAMELELVADLRDGQMVSITEGDVRVSLAIDAEGEPQLTFVRFQPGKSGEAKSVEKVLKALPAQLKKQPSIAAVIERKSELLKSLNRMRTAMEEAMVRGDEFEASELVTLLGHPLLAPVLQKLLFIEAEVDVNLSSNLSQSKLLGYPVVTSDGLVLRDYAGNIQIIAPQVRLRIAHPYDLLANGNWTEWQRECFVAERVQPFKQIFRELYILSDTEKARADGTTSARYSGQQLQPNKAKALLGARNWLTDYYGGDAHRTYHRESLCARLEFEFGGFTPLDVEGLTVGNVYFTRRGDWRPLPLSEVPPRIFSETMRDLDLVVSVAHAGGVDPEASQSTVEMRAALVSETCVLLGLSNVKLKSAHAIIEGELATYSVHLGSAVVHRQPGQALCIVGVQSPQRGRLFLPFADNDPRTAEVVSKVLLLAKDKLIKDPTILEQLL